LDLTGRRLHNKLHNLNTSPDMTIKLRWAGHTACMAEMRNAYKILVRKPEGKGPPRIPRHRWGDNVRMNVWEIGL